MPCCTFCALPMTVYYVERNLPFCDRWCALADELEQRAREYVA